MYLCYIDEAGCTGALPSAHSHIQPTFTIVAFVLPSAHLAALTHDWIQLKERFFGDAIDRAQRRSGRPHYLEGILHEIKGSELRNDIASGRRRKRRHHIGVLDATIRLIRTHHGQFVARSLVKGIGVPIAGRNLYTSFVQSLCQHFQHFLATNNASGWVIADSRNPTDNTPVAHSIFTGKHRASGDLYPNLVEMPTFGHSDNHAGLQIADLLASALLTPAIIAQYCHSHLTGTHIRPGYHRIRTRYTNALRELQYRYRTGAGDWRGGLHVQDRLGGLRTSSLFAADDLEKGP